MPNAPDEISKMWQIFTIGTEDPISLRALSPQGARSVLPVKNITFTASKYPAPEDRKKAFEAKALRLNAVGYNIYIVMNPIRPDFEGDDNNGIAVRDGDILCRRLLLIDCDRTNAVGPIHEDEIDEVLAFAGRIEAHLLEVHDLESVMVFSGNGVHLYLPLDDLPNDTPFKTYCQNLLQGFAAEFDTIKFKVDTSVYNASRITKVPGTIARKGSEDEDHPYQMAQVVE